MKTVYSFGLSLSVVFMSSSSLGQSMNGAANQGSGSNMDASSISNAIGSSQLASGNAQMPGCSAQMCSCCPSALMQIMQGLMGLAQGGANKDTGDQQAGVADITSAGGGGTGDTSASTTTSVAQSLDQVASFGQGKKVVDGLKAYGVTYKNGTFTMPNGGTISAGDVGSQSAMEAAGVTPAEFAKNNQRIADLEKKLSAELTKPSSGSGYSDSGGGSGSSSSHSSDSELTASRAPAKVKDAPVSVAGMSRNFNGDMVGVAGDNLFVMMNRRYQQKSRDEGFLPADSAPH